MKTRVVDKYTEHYDVYIGRGSKWGTPFSWKPGTKAKYLVSTCEEAIQKSCHGDVLIKLIEEHVNGGD